MTAPSVLTDLRDAPDLHAQALALNRLEEEATAPLSPARLAALLAEAAAAPALAENGTLLGFLLGFGPGAAYDSPNYRWFAARHTGFAYIDRVIVAPPARGRGVARALYAAFAAACPGAPLVCEVNLTPPNPGSDSFHARLGFAEAGRGTPYPGRTVRYLIRPPD